VSQCADVRILGSIEIRADGTVTVPRRRLARLLLGVLALRPNTAVRREWLADALWSGRPPASAAANLRSYVAELRRALPARIVADRDGYRLEAAPDGLDLLRFEAYAAAGTRALAAGLPDVAADRLGRARAQWRGPLFDGTAIPPALAAAAAALEDRRLAAAEAHLDALLALGRHEQVLPELARLTAAHGLRERLWQQRVRALWRAGRPAEALVAYDQFAALLDRELGAVPAAATRALADRIRGGDAAHRAAGPVPWQLPPAVSPFTGRAAELAALDRPGDHLVTGTAGVGKTALVLHWARRAAGRFPDGCVYADLGGFGPGRPRPPAAVLATLLRGLGAPAGDAELYRTLCRDRRLLVVLDNARSAEQVRPLLPGGACTTVVTSRQELPGLTALHGLRRLPVGLLPRADAVALLAELLPGADPALLGRLAERCARLPLALRLAAARLPSTGAGGLLDALASSALDALSLPGDPRADLRAVFGWSYRALPPAAAAAFRDGRASPALAAAHLHPPHALLRAYARELARR
jgi:DNA-binding SARP family transcriptional activator